MQGVGPGTVLGGRYALQRRLAKVPRAERWSAHDTTLEREVVLVCFAAGHPSADAALDAARRVAGLDNHRLVRILDVGRTDEIAFFVEEWQHGANTLTSLLEHGGLPSEEVRRIVGEAATALEAARGRGLHHQLLTPDSVLRTPDGSIRVAGVATDGALADLDEVDPGQASRADAIGIVAIAYAALTSRWPLPGRVPGLEQAPHVVGGVPAPSEIAAGVPGDLDALCRLTLNEDEGPLTPGDFASQIAPWSPTQVTGLGGAARGQTAAAEETAPLPTGAEPTLSLPVAGGLRPARRQPPKPSQPSKPSKPSDAEVDGVVPDEELDAGSRDGDPDQQPGAAGSDRPGGAAAGAAAGAVAGAVGTALGTAGHAAGQAAGAAAHRVGSFAKAAADKAAERRAERAAAEARAEELRVHLDETLAESDDTIEPPLPMLPPDTAEQPSRDQSKLVLAIIAGFLALATLVGFWGVSQIGAGTDLGLSDTPKRTVTVTASPTAPGTTATPSQTPTAPVAEPLAILRANGFDPEGDGRERNSEAPRVYDGDTSTFWSSEGYASADLGGLKPGVGVILDLGQAARVNEVVLTLPDASDLTVYLAEDSSLDGAAELGTSSGKDGEVTLASKDTEAAGRYVIVWFTKVSQVSDGRFRATLAEVSLR